jgi:hypothetical protein
MPRDPDVAGSAGFGKASSDPPPGLVGAVAPEKPEEVARRGALLADLRLALALATREGLPRAGRPNSALLQPLADVDPGGTSGQVVFLRWRTSTAKDPTQLQLAGAERWLLVSMNLARGQVLSVEPVSPEIERGGRDEARLEAILAAQQELAKRWPGAAFELHCLVEDLPVSNRLVEVAYQLHVYAFGIDDAPDAELVFTRPKRKLVLGGLVEVRAPGPHPAGLATLLPDVGPMTVARALAAGAERDFVEVTVAGGGRTYVSARSGLPHPGPAGAAPP